MVKKWVFWGVDTLLEAGLCLFGVSDLEKISLTANASLTGPQVRSDWISACQFKTLENSETLRRVISGVTSASAPPFVILDLDSTLYEVARRTFRILREWGASSQATSITRDPLSYLTAEDIRFSVRDTLIAAGLDVENAAYRDELSALREFWWSRFFTSSYLKEDRPYPGAVDFVQRLFAAGAHLVYLTGREKMPMLEGTLSNLIRDQFPPLGDRVQLVMKDEKNGDDLAHKIEKAANLRRHGEVIASFDNEPRNVVGLYHVFPEAMHIFVDTYCSEMPAMPIGGLYRIKSFLLEVKDRIGSDCVSAKG